MKRMILELLILLLVVILLLAVLLPMTLDTSTVLGYPGPYPGPNDDFLPVVVRSILVTTVMPQGEGG